MPASAEWEVRAVCTLADHTIAVINLLFILVLGSGVLIPTVGIPVERLREALIRPRGDTRGGEDIVGGGDHIGCALHGHRVLNSTDNRVNRGVNAKSFLDDLGVKIQFLEALVGERRQILAKDLDLFLVKLIHDLGASSHTQNDPGSGGR
jgi:hypothetical protein